MQVTTFILFILSLILPLASAQPATAQDRPKDAVRIVVPVPVGGAAGTMARKIASRLAAKWKQPVLIENKPGAGEIIATLDVLHAKPDGYTLLLGTDVQQTNPFLFSKLPYNPMVDLMPITRIAEGPEIYVVRRESPYETLQQLVAAAWAHLGKVSHGSGGVGGTAHLAVSWFATMAGNLEFLHVPYKGASDRMVALLAGNVDFTAVPLSAISGLLQDNRLRALATSGAARLRSLPNVPTLGELGYKDSVVQFLLALFGPSKMPPNVANQISRDVAVILKDPAFVAENFDPFGYVAVGDTPAEFAQFLAADYEKQRARVKVPNVKME